MASSVPALPSILEIAPRKQHFLTLPLELRTRILDFACMDAEISFKIYFSPVSLVTPAPCILWKGRGPSQLPLLLVCSQIHAEARPCLVKRLSLRSEYDYPPYSKGYVQQAIGNALLNPRIPPIFKFARPFMAQVSLRSLRDTVHNEGHPWNNFWLTMAFPSLRYLHLGVLKEPHDICPLQEDGMKYVRQLAEDSGLEQSWKGHLVVQTLERNIRWLFKIATPQDGKVSTVLDICVGKPDSRLTHGMPDEVTHVRVEYSGYSRIIPSSHASVVILKIVHKEEGADLNRFTI